MIQKIQPRKKNMVYINSTKLVKSGLFIGIIAIMGLCFGSLSNLKSQQAFLGTPTIIINK